jgi:hypothetical protein
MHLKMHGQGRLAHHLHIQIEAANAVVCIRVSYHAAYTPVSVGEKSVTTCCVCGTVSSLVQGGQTDMLHCCYITLKISFSNTKRKLVTHIRIILMVNVTTH